MSDNTAVIRIDEELNSPAALTSVNAAQYATLLIANPLISQTALPEAQPAGADQTHFYYNDEEEGDMRLTLDLDGNLINLHYWDEDLDPDGIAALIGEEHPWVDVDRNIWDRVSIAVRGTSIDQQRAIDLAVEHKSSTPTEVGRDSLGNVLVVWRDPEDNLAERFELGLNPAGEILSVGYSIFTDSDREEGVEEPEWYRCTPIDGPWEELVDAGLTNA